MSGHSPAHSKSMMRLDRLLVTRKWCSRKDAQKLIRRGHVSIDGALVTTLNQKVPEDITLMIDDVICAPDPLLVMYHKPFDQLSTMRDPWGREGLEQALPERWRTLFHPVGRLDAETTGLLLFSRDGSITQRILHPKRSIERTYRATVSDLPEGLSARLAQGVETALGVFTGRVDELTHRAHIVQTKQGPQPAAGEVLISVHEGKHRMVRRMLHNAGASVLALHRVAFGAIELSDLPSGESRGVSDQQLEELLDVRP